MGSGDAGPGSRTLGTFNPLYPKADYFTDSAVIGVPNLVNAGLGIELNPSETFKLTPSGALFWRTSVRDGIYDGLGMLSVAAAPGRRAREVGAVAQLIGEWQATRHLYVKPIYEHFFLGAALRQAGARHDIDRVRIVTIFIF